MPVAAKILVIDDSPAMCAVCSALLTESGYEVDTAADGFIALLYLAKTIPDLILCDLNLPRMSGFELLSVVRRRFPEVRVMAMSGAYVGDSVPGGVLADAFYSKGQSPKLFLGGIAALLETSKPSRHSRELAAVWIPLDSTDSNGLQYVAVTCPGCFRTFPLTVAPIAGPEILSVACVFCGYEVKYKNDFTRVAPPAKDSSLAIAVLSEAAAVIATVEASAGATNDEIAIQVPLI